MPAKIIPFPYQNTSALDEIDQRIRASLASMSLDETLINHVGDRMKNYIEKYASTAFDCRFNLPVPYYMAQEERNALLKAVEAGIQDTADQVQEMVNQIILERISLEIELYESKNVQKKKPELVVLHKKSDSES